MEEIVKVIKVETKQGQKSINQLKDDIKDLKRALESTQVGTAEYEQILRQLARTQKQYSNVMQDVNVRTQSTAKSVQSLLSVATGLGRAYASVTGIMSLMISDDKKLNDALGKTAKVLQIIEGFKGFTQMANQLPNVIRQVKDWYKSISGVSNEAEKVAKSLGSLNDININVKSESSGSKSSSKSSSPVSDKDVKNIDAQNNAIKTQTQLYPALLKQQENSIQKLNDLRKQYAEVQTAMQQANARAKELGTNLLNKTPKEQLEWAKQWGNAIKEGKKLDGIKGEITEQEKAVASLEKQLKQAKFATSAFGKAWNTLKAALATAWFMALVTAIIELGKALYKSISELIKMKNAVYELNNEVAKGANQISAKSIVALKQLAQAYRQVGDDAKSKEQFLKDYNDKIKDTGLYIDTVNEADEVFIKNTSKYISALMSRAKAQASENVAIQKYQEFLDKQADIEKDLEKHRQMTKQQYISLLVATGSSEAQAEEAWYTASDGRTKKLLDDLKTSESQVEATMKRLFDNAQRYNEEYTDIVGDLITPPDNDPNEDAAAKAAAEERKKELEELAKYYKAAEDLFKEAQQRELDDINAKYDAQIALAEKYDRDTKALEDARNKEIQDVEDKYAKEAEQKKKEETEKLLQDLQNDIERIRKMYDTSILKNPAEANFTTEYKQSGVTAVLGLGKGWVNSYQSGSDVRNEFSAQIEYNNQYLELTKQRIAQENELLNEQLWVEGITADRKFEIERTLAENKMALDDAVTQNEKANLDAQINYQKKKQQALNATLDVASNVFGSMASFAKTDAQNDKKSEADRKKAMKAYKALAVTQATIDTYKAANEAYAAMASIPYVGPELGIAAAAAAVVAGIANVKAILSESIPTSTDDPTSVQAPVTAQYPVEYTRNLLGDREQDEINNQQIWVSVTDINNVQNRVRVTEENASF